MVKETIGGRPVDVEKEGGELKVVFHPIAKAAKHPDAAVFTVKIGKKDIEMLRKML